MAAKLKDGLFIGDLETSQDPEFLELNKISNLVSAFALKLDYTNVYYALALPRQRMCVCVCLCVSVSLYRCVCVP
jgi:hypothetical protein